MASDPKVPVHPSKLIKIVAVSVMVLVVSGIGFCCFAYTQYNAWQKNEYWAVDVGRMFRQACGLESNDVNRMQKDQTTFYDGVMRFFDGLMAERTKQTDVAINHYREALELFAVYPGYNNIYALDCFTRMASLYEEKGKFREAEECYKQSIDCARAFTNKNSYLVAKAYLGLGIFYNKQGRYDESTRAFQTALDIDVQGLGPENRTVQYDYWWLALAQHGGGKRSEAISSLDGALKVATKEHNNDDAAKLTLYKGVYFYELKQYQNAENSLAQAVSLFGTETTQAEFYNAKFRLADAMCMNGKTRLADQIAISAIPKPNTLTNHFDRATVYRDAARYFALRSDYSQATALYRDALDASERAFSKTHMNNLPVLVDLARCLYKQHKLDECSDLYKRAIELCDRNRAIPSYELLCTAAEVFRATNKGDLAKSMEQRAQELKSRRG